MSAMHSPMRCGIYETERPDEWTHGATCYARCPICQHTFTHYRRDSARELFKAHLAAAERPQGGAR